MKKIILLTGTALMLSTPAFAAGNLKDFVGKYKMGHCPSMDGKVAYVRQVTGDKGAPGISINIYGGDHPSGFDFYLGTVESKPMDESGPLKHTEYKTEWAGSTIVSTTTDVYKSGKRALVSRHTFEKTRTGLTSRDYIVKNQFTDVCFFIKN